jgi:hypothetical protein
MKQFWWSVRRSPLAHADHLACAAFTTLFSVPAMLFVKGRCFLPEHGVYRIAGLIFGVLGSTQQVGRLKVVVSHFRFRISTALIAIALAGFPFATLWLHMPNPFPEGSVLGNAYSWLFFDLSPSLFGIGFLASLLTAIVVAIQHKWRSIPQCIIEMAICITFIPAY